MAVGNQKRVDGGRVMDNQGASPSTKAPSQAPPTVPAPQSSPQDPVAPADRLSPLQVCVPRKEDITFPVIGEAGHLRGWGPAGTGKACLGHLEPYRLASLHGR